ncbi:hypothetical protein GGI05_006480 [Coemansia sp. RSA 2603]|nr:hypothetical protein GGI05_006480 [Coemansia sp. RSA 2603]
MDIEYLGPSRNDYGDSDSESEAPEALPITVRLRPGVPKPTTLVVSPHAPASGSKIGVIQLPTSSSTHPLGGLTATTSQHHILQSTDTFHVVVSRVVAVELQRAWAQAVCSQVGMRRIVVVDTGDQDVQGAPVVVGLAAAVMNYADARGIPCRYVRDSVVGEQEIEELFARPLAHEPQESSGTQALRRDVEASLYV